MADPIIGSAFSGGANQSQKPGDTAISPILLAIKELSDSIKIAFPKGAGAGGNTDAARMSKELDKTNKLAKDRDDQFLRRFGVMQGAIQNGLTGVVTALLPIPTSLAGLMKQSVGAAAPGVFSTLEKSIQLAVMPIAKLFIPAILELSNWLQKAVPHIKAFVEEIIKAAAWINTNIIKPATDVASRMVHGISEQEKSEDAFVNARVNRDAFGGLSEEDQKLEKELRSAFRRNQQIARMNEGRDPASDYLRHAPAPKITFDDKNAPAMQILPQQGAFRRHGQARAEEEQFRMRTDDVTRGVRGATQAAGRVTIPGIEKLDKLTGPIGDFVRGADVMRQGQAGARGGRGRGMLDDITMPGYQARFEGLGDVTKNMQLKVLETTSIDAEILKEQQEMTRYTMEILQEIRNRDVRPAR